MKALQKEPFIAKCFITELGVYKGLNGDINPPYDTGQFRVKHYNSVYFGLLIAQKGLCAYSESPIILQYEYLINEFDPKTFMYSGQHINTNGFLATIDHFDSELKTEFGWELPNLFLVLEFINNDKGTGNVPSCLNPSNPNYKPEDFMFYSFSQHWFYANEDIAEPLRSEIQTALDKELGINSPSIISQRKDYLKGFKFDLSQGITLDLIKKEKHNKFFTAFRNVFILSDK